MWSICQGMGFKCGVFVKVWVLYVEYVHSISLKNTPPINPIPLQILHIQNPYLDNYSTYLTHTLLKNTS